MNTPGALGTSMSAAAMRFAAVVTRCRLSALPNALLDVKAMVTQATEMRLDTAKGARIHVRLESIEYMPKEERPTL